MSSASVGDIKRTVLDPILADSAAPEIAIAVPTLSRGSRLSMSLSAGGAFGGVLLVARK